jgi:hypothetical protein
MTTAAEAESWTPAPHWARATLGSSQAGPPQHAIPLHAPAVAIEAGHGRFVQARAEAQAALDAGFAPGFGLTTREREILRHVAAGHTNRRIAEELFIANCLCGNPRLPPGEETRPEGGAA